MKKVTVITTNGSNQHFDSDVRIWGDLVEVLSELNVSTDGMKATLGGSKLTLDHPEAELPNTDFKVYLNPVKIKAGRGYNLSETPVADMSYRELKDELKSIRGQANEADDDSTVSLIGNYTRMSTDSLRNTLSEVREHLTTSAIEVGVQDSSLAERVLALELHLNIRNVHNCDEFDAIENEKRRNIARGFNIKQKKHGYKVVCD